MTDYLYSPGELAQEVRRSEAEAKVRPQKRVVEEAGDLQVTRSIPKKLFMNAVVGHGVDPCDQEYFKDMERYVPSIKVESSGSRIFFGPLNRYQGPRKMRNRFGNVTYRKVYPG